MNPTVEQLREQFGRLVATAATPSRSPSPAAPAPDQPAAASGEGRAAGSTPPTGQPAGASPAAPASPLQQPDFAAKGWQFDATVAPPQVVVAAEILDKNGFALDAVTGVDWIAQEQMEVVYDYFHPAAALRAVVRTRVPRATPELPTISPVFPGANWHERETHDFFGIRFLGHPNLTPFLLPEDADFHPLRKDYQP